MANYSLVVNSKFRPFEFSEMLQPVLIAEQAHRELEDAYSELATKANIWDKMTNPETDTRAHKIYESYARDLEQQAAELARYGLTPSSRQSMLNMRGRYSRDIVPIENAYKRKQAQMEEQRKALLQNPTLLLSRRASTTSLDDYLDNPNLDYENYSGALLTQQVSQQAAALAKELTDYGNGKKLDAYTNTFLKRHGFTREQVLNAINNPDDPRSSAVLDAIVNSTIKSSGIKGWADEGTLTRGYYYAKQGLWSAIGQTDVSPYENRGAVMAQQVANQKKLIDYQIGQQAAQKAKMYDVGPTNYYSATEVAQKNRETAKELDKWKEKGYFTSTGALTKRGFAALNYRVTDKGYYSRKEGHVVGQKTEGDLDFLNWAKGLGVTNPTDPRNVKLINTYYKGTRTSIARGELPTGTANFPVYRQALGAAQYRNIVADKIFNVLGKDGEIYRAGSLKNGVISQGEALSVAEFMDKVGRDASGTGTSNILYIVNVPATGQQLIELVNGEKFLLPIGVLELNTQQNLDAANQRVRQAGSTIEAATELNAANSYLGSMLTTVGGTEIKPNDGTITVTW